MSKKIMIEISLVSYLKEITKDWGEVFATKTYGGQVYLSNEAPGELFKEEGKNYIEFNDSDVYIRIPKVAWEHIPLENGEYKKLNALIYQIKKLENSIDSLE